MICIFSTWNIIISVWNSVGSVSYQLNLSTHKTLSERVFPDLYLVLSYFWLNRFKFSGRIRVWKISKFDPSSLKQFEIIYLFIFGFDPALVDFKTNLSAMEFLRSESKKMIHIYSLPLPGKYILGYIDFPYQFGILSMSTFCWFGRFSIKVNRIYLILTKESVSR